MTATIIAFPGVCKERLADWTPPLALRQAWSEHIDMIKRLSVQNESRKSDLPSGVQQ